MRFLNQALLSVLVISASLSAQAGRINLAEVLFGIEYTFQDQAMVDEPGRNTISTPYKEQKAGAIVHSLARIVGLPNEAVVSKETWKPGHYLIVPNDGKWVVNAEPVTIEINTTPRHYDEIEKSAEPLFAATEQNGLVPYVNPAAERSGMGHIHVGAKNMGENPFFTNPLLLRNMMVYLHKHPALLYGFSEAYDNGLNSNIETYHIESRQREFQKAVAEFDKWYDLAPKHERQEQGFNKFIEILNNNDRMSGFFEHYRFINLEHVRDGKFKPTDMGKLTVEFRNFRPPKDPKTAKAFAKLLIAMMEKQSEPGVKEPFVWITANQYNRFNTGTKVAEDWANVSKDLKLSKDKHLNAAVREYVTSVQKQKAKLSAIPDAEIFNSYSEKQAKGTFFELRLPVTTYPEEPRIEAGGKRIEFEKVTIAKKSFWIASLDSTKLQLSPIEILNDRADIRLVTKAGLCKAAWGGI